ncbi:hypothetical protein L3Y34_006431 [Caenorhabditis briggsae]|uniref:Uncharacterized protein n=1 Tax=Caenorhabditis briggsae TaxID=6238 RepID=A0AAE9CXW1_CAEBR|nr:hypothetical protein L3Y34_006431 [Caenorhabditis briggsae]
MFLVRVQRRIARRDVYTFSRQDSDRQPLIEAPTPTIATAPCCNKKRRRRGNGANMKRLLERMRLLV